MRNFGYARVSTVEQNMDMQIAALRAAGCGTVLTDEGFSGADFARPGLTKMLRTLRRGDTLTVRVYVGYAPDKGRASTRLVKTVKLK